MISTKDYFVRKTSILLFCSMIFVKITHVSHFRLKFYNNNHNMFRFFSFTIFHYAYHIFLKYFNRLQKVSKV